jgi:hypothetical protein
MTNVCVVADRAETSGKFLLLSIKFPLMLKKKELSAFKVTYPTLLWYVTVFNILD